MVLPALRSGQVRQGPGLHLLPPGAHSKGRGRAHGVTAKIIQFPLRLADACTAHKLQGTTNEKGRKFVVHGRKGMPNAMAYVMLSRVANFEDPPLVIILHFLNSNNLSIYIYCLICHAFESMGDDKVKLIFNFEDLCRDSIG